MKVLLHITIVLFCFYSILSADEIYLKDSKIIKCKIIQITDNNIEYKEEGGKPFEVILKSLVSKVVYDDGKVVEISGSNNYDKIFLKDENIIAGTIVQVTPEVVIYIAEGSDKKEAIVRNNIIKIIYSDGAEVLISETDNRPEIPQPTVGIEPPATKQEAIIHSGGYVDSIFRLSLIGGYGFVWGDLHDKENNAFDRNKNQVPTYPVYPSDDKESYIYHDSWHGGFELGLLFPAIKYTPERAFGLTGIKFGLITNYVFSYIEQDLNDTSLEEDNYSKMLLKYNTINAGPEMNIILGPKSNRVNLVFRFYLLGGYIHQGKLRAVPGLREAGFSIPRSEYATDFTGYSATTGAGIRFVSNIAFPVITGIDIQYTYSKINFDRSLQVYNGASSSSFNNIGMLMSFGVHF